VARATLAELGPVVTPETPKLAQLTRGVLFDDVRGHPAVDAARGLIPKRKLVWMSPISFRTHSQRVTHMGDDSFALGRIRFPSAAISQ